MVQDRPSWRASIKEGSWLAVRDHAECKKKAANIIARCSFICTNCDHTCAFRIDLFSHTRSCKRKRSSREIDVLKLDEAHSMTFWSCALYVVANIIALFLYWLYQQQRAQRQRQEELDDRYEGHYEGGSVQGATNYRRQNRRAASQSSLLSILGLSYNGYKTFFAFEDRFSNFEDVANACRKAGLESCGLIVGVDFSASNEWQGRKTFSAQNLHKVIPGKIFNPYQKVISIIGRTLESFDEDNLIPAYGFGDNVTMGHSVFSFRESESGQEEPCKGFTDVLEKYGEIASKITLGGPTNFAPVINKAVDIVRNLRRYHILIVIADGQVTEQNNTVQAIVEASMYPLSIIMVGIGDGPWVTMEQFDNCLPQRCFDNFQFVNFHAIVNSCRKNPDASFALHAMMEIPDQYKTIKSLGYLDGGETSHLKSATETSTKSNTNSERKDPLKQD